MKSNKATRKSHTACPDCGSTNTMFRRTDHHYWCRRCPCEWTISIKGKVKRVKVNSTVDIPGESSPAEHY